MVNASDCESDTREFDSHFSPHFVIKVQKCIFLNKAEVVELVDAMDSKSITRNSVGVQVPFSAPLRIKALFRAFFFIKCILISI